LKVVLYGATGKSGSIILTEPVERGHFVIAAARTPEKVPKVKNVTAVQHDLSNPAKTASVVKTRGRRHLGLWAATSQIIGVMDRPVKAIEEAGGPQMVYDLPGHDTRSVAPRIRIPPKLRQ
jgi:uncharacterized protein YbjT (DUF2867 family)